MDERPYFHRLSIAVVRVRYFLRGQFIATVLKLPSYSGLSIARSRMGPMFNILTFFCYFDQAFHSWTDNCRCALFLAWTTY